MVVIVPRGLHGLIKLLAVELPVERNAAMLRRIDQQMKFVRQHTLVRREQETELVEMLIGGARLPDAVAELRARNRRAL